MGMHTTVRLFPCWPTWISSAFLMLSAAVQADGCPEFATIANPGQQLFLKKSDKSFNFSY